MYLYKIASPEKKQKEQHQQRQVGRDHKKTYPGKNIDHEEQQHQHDAGDQLHVVDITADLIKGHTAIFLNR